MIQKTAYLIFGICACLCSTIAADNGLKPSFWTQPIQDIDGNEHHQSSVTTKAVVWIFILEDCPISNAYSPEFNRLFDHYQSKGVSLILVHTNPNITDDIAKKHRKDYQLKPIIVCDRDHMWVKHAGAKVTPEAVLFDKKGKILYQGRIDDRFPALGKRRSHPSKTELRNAIDSFLKNKPILTPVSKAIGCYIPDLPAAP